MGLHQRLRAQEGRSGSVTLSAAAEGETCVSILHQRRSAVDRRFHVRGWIDCACGERFSFEERNERSNYETCRFPPDGD